MRAWAIICALANLAGVVLVALFMWFVASFPWENQSPEDEANADRLVPAAIVLVGAAGALLAAVVLSRVRTAAAAIAVQTAASVGVLWFALGGSDHSDGKLLVIAFTVESLAVASGVLVREYVARHRRNVLRY